MKLMKHSMLLLTVLTVTLGLGCGTAFAQHGGGHGAGPGMGMDQGRGRGADPGSKGVGNMDNSRAMGRTPGELLAQNTKLSSKLQALLPAGTNVQDAANGFRNVGQFVAAVHVSHNLDIPFSDLKSKMTSGASLGNAIRDLKPEVKAKDEAKRAQKQAKEMLQEGDA